MTVTDVSTTCAVVISTLKMTTAQVVETSVTVNNNSPIQDYVHPDYHIQTPYGMTPGYKPFNENTYCLHLYEMFPDRCKDHSLCQ